MKRVILIIVIAVAILASSGCAASRQRKTDELNTKRERLDNDQRQYKKTFDEEMKR